MSIRFEDVLEDFSSYEERDERDCRRLIDSRSYASETGPPQLLGICCRHLANRKTDHKNSKQHSFERPIL